MEGVCDEALLGCSDADRRLFCNEKCGTEHVRGCLVGQRLQLAASLLWAGVLRTPGAPGAENGRAEPAEYRSCSEMLLTTASIDRFHGRSDWAEASFELAKRLCHRWAEVTEQEGDWNDCARAYGCLSNILDEHGKCEEAASAQKKRLGLLEKLGDIFRQKDSLKQLGFIYRKMGRYHDSALAFDSMLELACMAEEDVRDLETCIAGTCVAEAQQLVGRVREALSMWNRVLEVATRRKDSHFISVAYGGMGAAYERLGMYGAAVDCCHARLQIEAAMEIPQAASQVTAIGNVGAINSLVGEHDSALHHLHQQLQLARRCHDLEQESAALLQLGQTQLAMGSLAAAWKSFALALRRAESAGSKPLQQQGLLGMGVLRLQLGDAAEGRRVLEQSLAQAQEVGSVRDELVARVSLARALELQGRGAEALRELEAAKALACGAGDLRREAQIKTSIGRLRAEGGELEEAVDTLEEAAWVLSRVEGEVGERDEWRVLLGEDHLECFEWLSQCLLWLERSEEAMTAADVARGRGLVSRLEGRGASRPAADPALEGGPVSGGDGEWRWLDRETKRTRECVRGCAGAVVVYGRLPRGRFAVWAVDEAGAVSVQVVELGERIRQWGALSSSQQRLAVAVEGLSMESLVVMLRVAMRAETVGLTTPWEEGRGGMPEVEVGSVVSGLYRWSLDQTGLGSAAIEALLHAWGAESLEDEGGGDASVEDRIASQHAEGDSDEEDGGAEVRGRRGWETDSDPLRADESSAVDEARGDASDGALASAEKRRLLDRLSGDAEAMERVREAWAEGVEVRGWLKEAGSRCGEEAIAAQLGQRVWRWEHLRRPVGAAPALQAEVQELLKEAPQLRRELEALCRKDQLLRLLYFLLLEPVAGSLTTCASLLVVSQLSLTMLPWAALQDARGKLLVQHFALRFAPSLRAEHALRQSLQRPAARGSDAGRMDLGSEGARWAVVVGEPLRAEGWGMTTKLPAAQREAKSVAEALRHAVEGGEEAAQPAEDGCEDRGVCLLTGRAAEKERVIGAMDGMRWLHFACHASLFPPALMLAAGSEAGTDDAAADEDAKRAGELRAEEVLRRVTLAAGSTVVLSACNTGRGRVRGAEGVVGLARSFLAAGAGSVLVSLWELGDENAKVLMESMYRHLCRGMTTTQALQHAMLEVCDVEQLTLEQRKRGSTHVTDPSYGDGSVLAEGDATQLSGGAGGGEGDREGSLEQGPITGGQDSAVRGRIGKDLNEGAWSGFIVVGAETFLVPAEQTE